MMILHVEFSPGDSLEFCCTEARRIATQLHVAVNFDFNKINCYLTETSDIELFKEDIRKAIKSNNAITLVWGQKKENTFISLSEMTCKGDYLLGTACGACSRCEKQKQELIESHLWPPVFRKMD